jgi:TonB-linked SusC/RagA family outer membrane protein
MMFVNVGVALAQSNRVTGVVKDEQGEPVIGAVVKIVGSTKAAVTDFDGKFAIDAPAGSTLRFSYLGMRNKTVKVDNSGKPLVVDMEPDIKDIKEVVVTALGIKRDAKSLSYARQGVDTETMTEARGSNLLDMLSGKAAGLQVISGGGPTASTRVVLRGINSLTGNNQPLFVIDGVPMLNEMGESGDLDYGNAANAINPDEIASIEVLKGANASALYGSDAANGVILITTKSAKAQKGLGVSYSFNAMIGYLYNYPTYQNIYGPGYNMRFTNRSGANLYGAAGSGVSFDPDLPYGIYNINMAGLDQRCFGLPMLGFDIVGRNGEIKKYSPHPETIKNMYGNSLMTTHNLQIQKQFKGGGMVLNYTGIKSDDILKGVNDMTRHTFNYRTNYDITQWLRIDATARYMYESTKNRNFRNRSNRNPLYLVVNMPRDVSLDELIPWKKPDGTPFNSRGFTNPYWALNETGNADNKNWFMGNLTFTVQLNKDLSVRLRGATEIQGSSGWVFTNLYSPMDIDGEYSVWRRTMRNTNYDALVTYNKYLFDNKFNVNATAGVTSQEVKVEILNTKANMLQFQDVKSLANAKGIVSSTQDFEWKKKQAVFATASFGYNSWAYFDVTARNEWSSALPADNRSYFYWSAGTGLVLSEVLKLDKHLAPFLKLRGSFAAVGNDTGFDRLRSGYYMDQNDYTFQGVNYYTGDKVLKTMSLKPERTESWELGVEGKLIDSRLNFDLTYYNKRTKDQIVEADAPLASGYLREIINAGELANHGFEVSLTGTPVKTKNFEWSVTVNWSKNYSMVKSLSEGVQRFQLGSGANIQLYAEVGQPYGVFYGNDYKRNEKGYVCVGLDGSPKYVTNQYLGCVQPDWFGGLRTNVKAFGFEVAASFDFQKGGKVWSYTAYNGGIDGHTVESLEGRYEYFYSDMIMGENNNERYGFLAAGQTVNPYANFTDHTVNYLDASRRKGVSLGVPTVYDESVPGLAGQLANVDVPPTQYWCHNNAANGPRYLYDASYIKFRELSVGYNVPSKFVKNLKLQSAKVSVVGRNIAILHQNTPKGLDPQATSTMGNAQGFEWGFTLPMATWGFDFKVSF